MSETVELLSPPDVDPRLTILRVGDEVDAFFVRTERFDVLVDTLGTPKLCRSALGLLRDGRTSRPLIAINSHMDWDHFWGNTALPPEVPIIAHERALARLNDGTCSAKLREKSAQDARFRSVRLVAPTLTFSNQLTLHGGDLTLTLMHTPGHTPDHLAIWIPEIATCIAVDAAEAPIPEVWSSDPDDLLALRESLERMRRLGPKVVLPAHGQVTSPTVLDRNIAYFDGLSAFVARQTLTDLESSDLSRLSSVSLAALVPKILGLDPRAKTFYQSCHLSNLRAAITLRLRARGERRDR